MGLFDGGGWSISNHPIEIIHTIHLDPFGGAGKSYPINIQRSTLHMSVPDPKSSCRFNPFAGKHILKLGESNLYADRKLWEKVKHGETNNTPYSNWASFRYLTVWIWFTPSNGMPKWSPNGWVTGMVPIACCLRKSQSLPQIKTTSGAGTSSSASLGFGMWYG